MVTDLTVRDAVRRARTVVLDDETDEDYLVLARKPWQPESPCHLVHVDAKTDGAVDRARLTSHGFEYMLEFSTAREVFEVLESHPVVSDEDFVRLFIHYAEHDAFPEWVYEDPGLPGPGSGL